MSRLRRSRPSTIRMSKRAASASASSTLPPRRRATGTEPLTPSSACSETICQPSFAARSRAATSWSAIDVWRCRSVENRAYRATRVGCVDFIGLVHCDWLGQRLSHESLGQQTYQLRARGKALVIAVRNSHTKPATPQTESCCSPMPRSCSCSARPSGLTVDHRADLEPVGQWRDELPRHRTR
jgi:hypothetical protein